MGHGNQITIKGEPDIWKSQDGAVCRYTGTKWIQSIAVCLAKHKETPSRYVTVDLSNLRFVTLFEWTTLVSMLESVLHRPEIAEIGLDFVGSRDFALLSPQEWKEFKATGRTGRMLRPSDFDVSTEVYGLVGFAESLGTRSVLARPERSARVIFPQFGENAASFRQFYTRQDGAETVLLGLTRIESRDNCRQFLDESRIQRWRSEMNQRFRQSPLFEFDEVWRVFCHELSVNIWEHAQIPGFLSARVVTPCSSRGALLAPWRITYPSAFHPKLRQWSGGFLELCVCDYGNGFGQTLQEAYQRHAGSEHRNVEDLLSFAFDELGTCKNANEGWLTERHALGRILMLVAKYGGILRLRSAGGVIYYSGSGGHFRRRPGHRGYEANGFSEMTHEVAGAQIQALLPLVPLIPRHSRGPRISILDRPLPRNFYVDKSQVRGHLVPLLEQLDCPHACVGRDEQLRFRGACEKLCCHLLKYRADQEPLLLDFSGVDWTPAQFETLVHLLQNVLQFRPVLLVELHPQLAKQIAFQEAEASRTWLNSEAVATSASITGKTFVEIPEAAFFETFRRVHCALLAIDRDGRKYLFGLPSPIYEEPLLSLIAGPRTIEELAAEFHVEQRVLRAILTPVSQLFEVEDGRWRCAWDHASLAAQANRVMSFHFDRVLEATDAWRGRPHNLPDGCQYQARDLSQLALPLGKDTGHERFNLPWQEDDEWVEEFLECSRVLSRERYADEAAQRLIYRLRKGLEGKGRKLSDVKALACVTSPAVLLATAMHRWWPEELQAQRPVVADLGSYILLHPDEQSPLLPGEGGVVVVQDVLSSQVMSGRLIEFLKKQGKEVLALLALVQLVRDLEAMRVTTIAEGWNEADGIPRHAMIQIRKPKSCKPPKDRDEGILAYWVEPRTLRPIPYRSLRREQEPGDADSKVPRGLASRELEAIVGPAFRVGHYVYGPRHYSLVIDIRQCLNGELGDRLAAWIADVCEGNPQRERAKWETLRGTQLQGDVTAVIMPLHSQIHYLWPKVENVLAQRGRRQVFWMLEATMFLGRGPAYRIPLQLEKLIDDVLGNLLKLSPNKLISGGLRFLILDDAIATARTAETVLDAIQRAVRDACARRRLPPDKVPPPVEWIRFFAVFNYMSHAQSRHWQDLTVIGGTTPVPFLFEHMHHCMGIGVYERSSCPCCRDASRMQRLKVLADQYGCQPSRDWAVRRQAELAPVAIDGPAFPSQQPSDMGKPVKLLDHMSIATHKSAGYEATNADTAIAMFYELMYRSYPPSDLLRSIRSSVIDRAPVTVPAAVDRYRAAALEWAVRNWPRITADSAREEFVECLRWETQANGPLMERVFESLCLVWRDPKVISFVKDAIDCLVGLEAQRFESNQWDNEDRISRVVRLNNGLNLFLLSVSIEHHDDLLTRTLPGEDGTLLEYLGCAAEKLAPGSTTFARQIHLRFTRPQRFAEPWWALLTVAESLFRGRDPEDGPPGDHQLLPLLLKQMAEDPSHRELILLLQGSLSLFLAALQDLQPYADANSLPHQSEIVRDGKALLAWLQLSESERHAVGIAAAELGSLREGLRVTSPFCQTLNCLFHEKVEALRQYFEDRANSLREQFGKERLAFAYEIEDAAVEARVLTHVERLKMTLCNWVIDAVRDFPGAHKAKVVVTVRQHPGGADRVCFRLLTSFAGPDETNTRIFHGRCADIEETMLRPFGIERPRWGVPSDSEKAEGYKAASELLIPAGFMKRRPL